MYKRAGACGIQKRALDFLELQLQVSCNLSYTGTGDESFHQPLKYSSKVACLTQPVSSL